MANNLAVTPGTGATMKTTDNAGVHTGHVNVDSLPASTNTLEVVGDVAHDAVAAGNPVLVAGYASAAAPTDVSADGDAVREWRLRNGAGAVVVTAAGALVGGDATNGLDVDVTRLPALAAGTNAIGKLAANSGVDIGDVDVTSVPTDPFGANADAASATGSISAKLKGIATALGVTAFDLGQGTGGSRTLRVAVDSAQLDGSEYETVAASQTAQVLGATGATGDYISKILVIPATTSPGAISLLDNATSITVFTGGASSVSNLVPFVIDLGMFSVSGAWKLTTGANVSCIGIGNFT